MNRESVIQNVNIEQIIPNRFQPRLSFDEKTLTELSNSIKEHGIIQPIVVRRLGDKFEIIAGERRYKAATIAGLTEVPVIISNLDDNKSAEIAIVENLQRKNLNSLEEAKSYKKLLEKENLTQEQLAQKMGISQSTIANKLRLLNLNEDVQDALVDNQISERHARSLLAVTDPAKQSELLNKVITERLTVKQLDDIIKNQADETPSESFTEIFSLDADDPLENAKNSIMPEEETKNKKSIFNIFDSIKPMESYPSLEDEQTNMNIEKIDEINPFDSIEEINQTPEITPFNEEISYEEPEKVNEPTILPEKEIIVPNNLDSVKAAYNDFIDKLKSAGYKVSNEDFDFEDLYQMIIKIEKQAE